MDADYKFLRVDLGAAGSSSDAQIFKHADLRHKIEDGTIGFPENESLVDDGPKVHYFILGDDAFPLKLWLMKPYSRRGMDLKKPGKKGGTECLWGTNVPLPDIPEANATGTVVWADAAAFVWAAATAVWAALTICLKMLLPRCMWLCKCLLEVLL